MRQPTHPPADTSRSRHTRTVFAYRQVQILSLESGELIPVGPGWASAYAPDGSALYFWDVSGVWRAPLSPEDGEPAGPPLIWLPAVPGRHLTVSADGKRLVLSRQQTRGNLWSLPISPATGEVTGPPQALTRDTNYRNNNAAFSPDGRRIVYQSGRTGDLGHLRLLEADGTSSQVDPGFGGSSVWLPGERILRAVADGTLRELDLTTRKSRRLATLEEGWEMIRPSPDGRSVAFHQTIDGNQDVWTWTVGSDSPRQLTFSESLDYVGRWSPDGDRISFASLRDGVWNLYWVSIEDGREQQLTNYEQPAEQQFVRFPVWSPVGDRIVYELAHNEADLWVVDQQVP